MKTLRTAALAILVSLSAVAGAQETPATWMKRILDPAELGLEPFPGSELNRKISVDLIRRDDPKKRIAIYTAPGDALPAVSKHLAKDLGAEPAIEAAGSEYERHTFQGSTDDTRGLTVTVMRSPWVTGKIQIGYEYRPPAKP